MLKLTTNTKHRAASLRQLSFLFIDNLTISKWRPSAILDFRNLQFRIIFFGMPFFILQKFADNLQHIQ